MNVLFGMQSSEVLGVFVLERCVVQLDDDEDDHSYYSFIIGKVYLFICKITFLYYIVWFSVLLLIFSLLEIQDFKRCVEKFRK